MKKIILLLVLCLVVTAITRAQMTTPNEATMVAKNFYFERINQYKQTNYSDINIGAIHQIPGKGMPVYYILNINPEGYVIISGNKKVKPVLAYSFTSSYNDFDIPPQFLAWTKQYEKQILHAIDQVKKAPDEITNEWKRLSTDDPNQLLVFSKEKEIAPLLYSTWDQGNYYNQMCPDDPAGPGGHCLTGCVATAMGQLCYYFRWPDTGVGSYSYELPDYGTISANFGETAYDWEAMANEATEPNHAIAELIFHMGVTVDMDYGPDGSGMWNHSAANSLKTYFKYSPETVYLYRDSTSIDWDSTIVAHLDQKIPMYYAGWSVPNVNGHGFICDGYQGEDFFHFNWGWGGSLDGYFYIDELSPGGNNFNLAQELIINAYPDTINYTFPQNCEGPKTLTSLNGSIEDGSSQNYFYENNLDCSWLISPQTVEDSVKFIEIEFHYFNTEAGMDFVRLYDGNSESDPLLGEFSGSDIPTTLVSSGNEVLVTFSTNGTTTDEGWFLTYHAETPIWCSGMQTLTTQTASFSDGSLNFNYHNNSACMWNIDPPTNGSLVLLFSEFDTEENKDFVKVYDAVSSELLGEFSGTFEPESLPDPIISPSGKMFVTFSSNATITHSGWSAEYTFEMATNKSPENSNFIIFPNPARDKVYIHMENVEKGKVEISLKSLNGQEISYQECLTDGNKLITNINTKRILPGVYMISITTPTKRFWQKVIIVD
jgi:hypothetical protein